MFPPLLADLDRAGEYAWGAASLSFLYSTLFRFSDGSSHQLGGNLPFFHVYKLSLLFCSSLSFNICLTDIFLVLLVDVGMGSFRLYEAHPTSDPRDGDAFSTRAIMGLG